MEKDKKVPDKSASKRASKKASKRAAGPIKKGPAGDSFCPECGVPVKRAQAPAGEEIFDDFEFVCPACCCGMYIEVKEKE